MYCLEVEDEFHFSQKLIGQIGNIEKYPKTKKFNHLGEIFFKQRVSVEVLKGWINFAIFDLFLFGWIFIFDESIFEI